MKNGYTPKEFAHSVAIDYLHSVRRAIFLGQYDYQLKPDEQPQAIAAITALRLALAESAKLDII
jgi:hypothetical protein